MASSPAFVRPAAAALALLALAPAAAGQSAPRACGERSGVVERLENRFGEVLQALGLNRGNAVVELYASAETGTWTILLTTPNGVSCMIASGELWESRTGPLLRPGSDA